MRTSEAGIFFDRGRWNRVLLVGMCLMPSGCCEEDPDCSLSGGYSISLDEVKQDPVDVEVAVDGEAVTFRCGPPGYPDAEPGWCFGEGTDFSVSLLAAEEGRWNLHLRPDGEGDFMLPSAVELRLTTASESWAFHLEPTKRETNGDRCQTCEIGWDEASFASAE